MVGLDFLGGFFCQQESWIRSWCEVFELLQLSILLMVQKSPGQLLFRCIKPYELWDKLPSSTGFFAGFLNHQQYYYGVLTANPSFTASFIQESGTSRYYYLEPETSTYIHWQISCFNWMMMMMMMMMTMMMMMINHIFNSWNNSTVVFCFTISIHFFYPFFSKTRGGVDFLEKTRTRPTRCFEG